MVDLQSVIFVCAKQKTSRLLSPERSAELVSLFAQFVPEYLETAEGKEHSARYGEGRLSGRTNWEEVQDLSARKKDITDAVLLKLLPYADTPANRKLSAWVHIAPCITGDLRGWFEAKGWTKASDWPHVARAIYDFLNQCTADPENLAQACSRFADSQYSKGFQAGMLSPILHALSPEHFFLINSKVRRVLKYLTDSDFPQGITSYPEANAKLRQLLDEAEDMFAENPLGELSHADAFDAFCHWLVAVRKHPFRDSRYWKIAPGEDAINWSN
jgi:5-methylcytosine-specific restriction protein B